MERRAAIRGRGNTIIIAAGMAETAGTIALLDYELAPGFAALPLHVHHHEDVAIYVLEGTLLVQVGEVEHRADPEAFVFLPRGLRHALRNQGAVPARFLLLLRPAGFEQFFLDLEVQLATGQSLAAETVARYLARYGVQVCPEASWSGVMRW